MRTFADRMRHAILFEVIGLILVVQILVLFGFDLVQTGVMGVFFSLLATFWNYIYNILFDKGMMKYTGTYNKTTSHRVLHALLFELGLLTFTIPILAWWMNISLWQAFVLDMGLVVFYLFYAYIYNFGYDKIFPIPTKVKLN